MEPQKRTTKQNKTNYEEPRVEEAAPEPRLPTPRPSIQQQESASRLEAYMAPRSSIPKSEPIEIPRASKTARQSKPVKLKNPTLLQ